MVQHNDSHVVKFIREAFAKEVWLQKKITKRKVYAELYTNWFTAFCNEPAILLMPLQEFLRRLDALLQIDKSSGYAEETVGSYGDRCYTIKVSPDKFEQAFENWDAERLYLMKQFEGNSNIKSGPWGIDAIDEAPLKERLLTEKREERIRKEREERQEKAMQKRRMNEEKRRQEIINEYLDSQNKRRIEI